MSFILFLIAATMSISHMFFVACLVLWNMFFIFFFTKLALVTGHPVKIPSHPKNIFFETSFNELIIFLFRGLVFPFPPLQPCTPTFLTFVATTLWVSYLALAWDSLLFLSFFSLHPSLIFTSKLNTKLPPNIFPLGTSTKIPHILQTLFFKKPLNPFQNQTSYSLDECLLKETRKIKKKSKGGSVKKKQKNPQTNQKWYI